MTDTGRPSVLLIAFATLIVLCTLTCESSACTCRRPGAQMHPLPPPGASAPKNVRPRLLYSVPLDEDVHAVAQNHQRFQFVCSLGSDKGVSTVSATTIRTTGYKSAQIEVVPARVLPAGASCALVDERSETLTWFNVTDTADDEPPSRAYIRGGTAQWASGGMCPGDGVEAYLEIVPPVDRVTPRKHLAYALWMSNDGERPDYGSPPTVWVSSYDFPPETARLPINSGESCNEGGRFPYPPAHLTRRIGVRVVDLAGNLSAPTEAILPGVSAPASNDVLGARTELSGPTLSIASLSPAPATRPTWPSRVLVPLAIAMALLVAMVVFREARE